MTQRATIPTVTPAKKIAAHEAAVSCIAFSPDGKLLASGGFDQRVVLHDVTSLNQLSGLSSWARVLQTASKPSEPLVALVGHTNTISLLSFSPDGRWLASSSWDGTTRIWDIEGSGKEYLCLGGHKGAVNGVLFLPDGRRLITCGQDAAVIVWDVTTGQEMTRLDARSNIMHLCVVPECPSKIITALGNQWLLWDVDSEKMLLYRDARGLRHIAVSSATWMVAAAGTVGKAVRYLPPDLFPDTPDEEREVEFSHPWEGAKVYLWDVTETIPNRPEAIRFGIGELHAVAFSPDGTLVVSAHGDKTAKLTDVSRRQTIGVCRGHAGAVHDVAFSPSGEWLATGGKDGSICLWDLFNRAYITHDELD